VQQEKDGNYRIGGCRVEQERTRHRQVGRPLNYLYSSSCARVPSDLSLTRYCSSGIL